MKRLFDIIGIIVTVLLIAVFVWAYMQKHDDKPYIPRHTDYFERGTKVQLSGKNGFEGLYEGCEMWSIAQQATSDGNEIWVGLKNCNIMPNHEGVSTNVFKLDDIEAAK